MNGGYEPRGRRHPNLQDSRPEWRFVTTTMKPIESMDSRLYKFTSL